MKNILIFTFIITLSVDSFARVNPFEPTDTFNEKKAEYYKIEEQTKTKELEKKQKELLLKQEQEAKKLAEKEKAKKIAQIKIEKAKKEKADKIKAAKLKAKLALEKENFKVLPFVKVEVINDILIISVDKKYKLLNQDILKSQKKLLFDFKGNVSFYTIRKNIKHKAFKSFAVGTHRKKNYFRVVIDLSDDIIKYKETITTKKGIITIQKIKK